MNLTRFILSIFILASIYGSSQNINFIYPIIDEIYSDSCHCNKYVLFKPLSPDCSKDLKSTLIHRFPRMDMVKFDSICTYTSHIADTFLWDQTRCNKVHFLKENELDTIIQHSYYNVIETEHRKVKITIQTPYCNLDTAFIIPRKMIKNEEKRDQYISNVWHKELLREIVEWCTYVSYPLFIDSDHFILTIADNAIKRLSTMGGETTYLYTRDKNGIWERQSIAGTRY